MVVVPPTGCGCISEDAVVRWCASSVCGSGNVEEMSEERSKWRDYYQKIWKRKQGGI